MANKTVQALLGNFNCMHLFTIKMANKAVRKWVGNFNFLYNLL